MYEPLWQRCFKSDGLSLKNERFFSKQGKQCLFTAGKGYLPANGQYGRMIKILFQLVQFQ